MPGLLLLGLRVGGLILTALGATDVINWFRPKESRGGWGLERTLLIAGLAVVVVEWWLSRRRGGRY